MAHTTRLDEDMWLIHNGSWDSRVEVHWVTHECAGFVGGGEPLFPQTINHVWYVQGDELLSGRIRFLGDSGDRPPMDVIARAVAAVVRAEMRGKLTRFVEDL